MEYTNQCNTQIKMPLNPTKILLIEDNPGDARLVQEELSDVMDFFFDLTIAGMLSTGIEHIEANKTDLILLDLTLPDSTGIDTFLKIFAKAKNTPIIVLSGLKDATLAEVAISKGANDYLVKGEIDSNLLIKTIKNALGNQRHKDELSKLSSKLGSLEIICITDSAGFICFVNPEFEKVTGYKNNEVINKKINILKSERHDDNFFKNLWNHILTGNIYDGIFINKRKNGEIFYEQKIITPIKDKDGNITHFISTGKEIITTNT